MHYIYVYMSKNTPTYTGETKNLLERNHQHFTGKNNWQKECDAIYFAEVKNQYVAEVYESYLINKYRLILHNSQHPDLWKLHCNLPDKLRSLQWHKVSLSEINAISTKNGAIDFYVKCLQEKRPYAVSIFDMCHKYD